MVFGNVDVHNADVADNEKVLQPSHQVEVNPIPIRKYDLLTILAKCLENFMCFQNVHNLNQMQHCLQSATRIFVLMQSNYCNIGFGVWRNLKKFGEICRNLLEGMWDAVGSGQLEKPCMELIEAALVRQYSPY